MLHCHCVWCRGVELAAHGVAGMSGCYITTAPTACVATMGSLGPSFPDHDHDLSRESCQNIRSLQNILPLLVFQPHLALVCLHPLLALEQWLDLIVYMSYIALCSCTQVFHMVLFLL